MRKIYLHGYLAEFGKVHEMEVQTAAEAVRALGVCIPGFFERLREGSYNIVVGKKRSSGRSLSEDDLGEITLGRQDLHIMPAIAGRKRGGLLKAILGVVLVGAAIFGGLAAGGLGASFLGTSFTYGNVAMFGAALALAGVSQLLAPSDKKDDKDDSSFTTSGPGNTYEQGGAIPLVYGEVVTGGIMVSAGVDIEKLK
ncbi:tail assembly protein [Phyllobacterium myrsinacearum]|uniref:Putative phage tail protein n=1 Tax=Phyllobacterium myrsinacearum TaxID=28101 RepID=A0A839EUF5_9HYPH|nr:tail assembly protein [Phyllobacterium myrsinacearum]MBA8881735.1 putative phage tail protein [Phyllobacterium myrsinacearum]